MKNDFLPNEIISLLRKESEGLVFGDLKLLINLRDGRPSRYEISKSISIMDESILKIIDGIYPKKEEVA